MADDLEEERAFRRPFEGFDPATVASYGRRERRRLLSDADIVRNRAKVDAVIENARRIVLLAREHGSFAAWLQMHRPRSLPKWCELFRESFRFMGGEIVQEFLMSIGYLPGAHAPSCPVFARIARAKPAWMQTVAARERLHRSPHAGAQRRRKSERTKKSP